MTVQEVLHLKVKLEPKVGESISTIDHAVNINLTLPIDMHVTVGHFGVDPNFLRIFQCLTVALLDMRFASATPVP
ncbi:hypothetical protein LshimejAT787_0501990 [Lyophyllum shimeji]|uniref:Uncharacterized protein n=1 Tax=Lyophyllum shimeji TaxID=47721 RepID=A0A9P3UKN9_LYOSH|nr:hypothetical protein LshimejAT787_0501990 [Lyophyllum shimeji]